MSNLFHTLVLHLSPDLEACLMAALILDKEEVRDRLGVVDHPALKFIPAGRLRPQDWPGETVVTAEALEAKGNLFLDCGGGALDQHGKPANEFQNSVSSIGIMVDRIALDEIVPHLMPLIDLVSRNDLYGSDIAPRMKVKGTATPHTKRHLRELVLGWNVLHKDNPSKVVNLVRTAFGCIERCIDRVAGQEGVDVRQFFVSDEFIHGAEAHVRTIIGLDAPDDEVNAAAATFRRACDEGFQAWEREWLHGERDYWNNARVRPITVARRTAAGVVYDTLTLAVGRSASGRFGAVTRLGNTGHKAPYPSRNRRNKADVTVQFYDDGRFVISTREQKRQGEEAMRITLERVARLVREADLRRRGVNLTKDDVRILDRKGHLTFTDVHGRPQEALFLAEYDTAFGNGFRANPFAPKTPLRQEEVVELVIKALGSVD